MSDSTHGANHSTGVVEYVVQQGDCLLTISERLGFNWETIWNDAHNQELKKRRTDPMVLLPGDRVTVPEKRTRSVAVPTDQFHSFVRKGVPAKLKLQVRENGQPLASQPFTFHVGCHTIKGFTGADGTVEVSLPHDAREALLLVGPADKPARYELAMGALDPPDTVTGAQARLANLGFEPGPVDGQFGPATKAALRTFQLFYGLDVTGDLDAATCSKLGEAHGS